MDLGDYRAGLGRAEVDTSDQGRVHLPIPHLTHGAGAWLGVPDDDLILEPQIEDGCRLIRVAQIGIFQNGEPVTQPPVGERRAESKKKVPAQQSGRVAVFVYRHLRNRSQKRGVIRGEPVAGVDDSKRLTERRREELFATLNSGPHATGVAIVENDIIDTLGIQTANYMAMARALGQLEPPADFALVDGFTIRGCTTPQLRIVKGDQRSQSIAAASILAKVTRDRIMYELDAEFPEYGFARHKGYATREHLLAIDSCGPCRVHRKSFAPMAPTLETLQLFQDTG